MARAARQCESSGGWRPTDGALRPLQRSIYVRLTYSYHHIRRTLGKKNTNPPFIHNMAWLRAVAVAARGGGGEKRRQRENDCRFHKRVIASVAPARDRSDSASRPLSRSLHSGAHVQMSLVTTIHRLRVRFAILVGVHPSVSRQKGKKTHKMIENDSKRAGNPDICMFSSTPPQRARMIISRRVAYIVTTFTTCLFCSKQSV